MKPDKFFNLLLLCKCHHARNMQCFIQITAQTSKRGKMLQGDGSDFQRFSSTASASESERVCWVDLCLTIKNDEKEAASNSAAKSGHVCQ